MSWTDTLTATINRLLRNIPLYNSRRIATVNMTNAEYLSLIGLEYRFTIDITLPDGGVYWYRFVAPSDRDVEIIQRHMMPNVIGVDYGLYLGTSGFTDAVTINPSRLNPAAGVAPTSIIRAMTLNTAPTTPGTLDDTPILIGAGGASSPNFQSGGTDAREEGFKFYPRGTGFFARIRNFSGTTQRIVFRLHYAELDASLIP